MAVNNKTYSPVQAVTIKAIQDLPAFRFVSHLGSLCSAGMKSLGVTEVDWVNGEFSAVVTLGTIAVETSTTINIGDSVTADANGKAKPAGVNDKINGRALDTAYGQDFITILLVP